MKNRLTHPLWKAMPFLALLCLFLTNSCKRELLQPNSNGLENALSFGEAKQYFETHLKQLAPPKKLMSTEGTGNAAEPTSIQDILYNKQPVWDKAYQMLASTRKAIKIPLDFGNVRKIVDESTKAYVPYSDLNYLFMYRDSLQQIHAEWVTLKPTLNWLNGDRNVFEGSIVVKDWNGNVLNTYNYGTAQTGHVHKLGAVKGTTMEGGTVKKIADGCLIWAVKKKCSCDRAWSSGTRQIGTWNPEKCDYCDLCVNYFCMPEEPKCESCPPPPDWGGGSGSSGSTGGSSNGNTPGGNGPSGGSPNPSDLEPKCTNGAQVLHPDGSMGLPPCISVPICENCQPTQNSGQNEPITVAQALINILNLDGEIGLEMDAYLRNISNETAVKAMFQYLNANGNNFENREFVRWDVGYLIGNPTISFEVFKNRFLGKVGAKDGDFDQEYWSNPKLSVPQQNLPSWADFSNNFPTHNKPNSIYKSYAELLTALGGDVGALYIPGGDQVNTCAIRVSYALVRSGITIPDIPARTVNGKTYPAQTLKDKDGKYYFIRAKELNAWMRRTFGTNDGDPKTPHNASHAKITKAQAGTYGSNLPALLSGKKGIYCLVSDRPAWSSGHADLLYDNATCGVECHFNGPIDWIDVWILQ